METVEAVGIKGVFSYSTILLSGPRDQLIFMSCNATTEECRMQKALTSSLNSSRGRRKRRPPLALAYYYYVQYTMWYFLKWISNYEWNLYTIKQLLTDVIVSRLNVPSASSCLLTITNVNNNRKCNNNYNFITSYKYFYRNTSI